jgi:hypothetical protein
MKLNQNLSLVERFNAPTSKFFQPIAKVCGIIAVIATGLMATLPSIAVDFSSLGVEIDVTQFLKYVAIINTVVTIFSKLTVDWETYAKENGFQLVFFAKKK